MGRCTRAGACALHPDILLHIHQPPHSSLSGRAVFPNLSKVIKFLSSCHLYLFLLNSSSNCLFFFFSFKPTFINYVSVLREGGGLEKPLHTFTLGRGRGSNPFLRNIFQLAILCQKSRGQVVWHGSYFICIWKIKKNLLGRAVFTCFDLSQTGSFSVIDPFLTTFYYVEKRNGILRKNRGGGLKSYVSLHGGRGVQKVPKSFLHN